MSTEKKAYALKKRLETTTLSVMSDKAFEGQQRRIGDRQEKKQALTFHSDKVNKYKQAM